MRKWVIIACVSFSIAAGSFFAYVRWCAIVYVQESMFYWEGDGPSFFQPMPLAYVLAIACSSFFCLASLSIMAAKAISMHR